MKMKQIRIKKKDGSILKDIEVEIQAEGKVAILYDLSIPVEVGDHVLSLKRNGKANTQLVEKVYVDEMMGSMNIFEKDDSVKATVMFLKRVGNLK